MKDKRSSRPSWLASRIANSLRTNSGHLSRCIRRVQDRESSSAKTDPTFYPLCHTAYPSILIYNQLKKSCFSALNWWETWSFGQSNNWIFLRTLHAVFYLQGVSENSIPPKIFLEYFLLRLSKSFCVKFCEFVANLYPHTSANFYTFILIFHQMALIFPWVPMVLTVSSFILNADVLRARTWWENHHFQLYPDKGWCWALLRKSAVESTTLAQPFCVNQAVGCVVQLVERRSLTGELSLSCARPAADGWLLMWVNRPL